ncbi:MAG: hypothetical protein H6577_08045 [Lewinellaceae bacterium]|nr:hypothetical protein [Saprospiraceae bacterium]MCB9338066.1 hypothetical protein [Lewinellaceae bacterium]
MKTLNLLVLSTLSLVLLGSCSTRLTYFTQDLYERYNWSENDLKKIQFYVSQDIVLKRELKGGSSDIVSGTIKIEDGRQIEEVIIRKGTPGAFIFSPKSERFAIGFEDSNERYLMFGPSPKFSDRYVMLASDWNRRTGEVTYDNKKWRVSSDDAFAALLVDLRKISKVDVNSRVAKGRKVD